MNGLQDKPTGESPALSGEPTHIRETHCPVGHSLPLARSSTPSRCSVCRRQQKLRLRFLDRVARTSSTSPGARPDPGSRLSAREFVQRHGRVWLPAPLPSTVARGPERHCYKNAQDLALTSRDLAYVEGYADIIEHAWCVSRTGHVFDPTWPNDLAEPAYFGVPFPVALVLGFRVRAGYCMSLLFDVEVYYPHLMADLEALIATEFLPVGVPLGGGATG
jgi:hypothetical protein